MGRKQTGLANRRRSGRSTYSKQHKSRGADRYARWSNGKRETADIIAGATLNYRPVNA